VPAAILFSFIITGCAETRYDNTVRTYKVGQNDSATSSYKNKASGEKYTVGQSDEATAKYSYRIGDRPPTQPRSKNGADYLAGNGGPIILDTADVLFEFDKYQIRKSYYPELDKWAEYFQSNPQISAEIYGHADSTGPTEYNQNLSEKRAQAIVDYLVGKGVESSRLKAVGFGETSPIVPNTTPEGRQQNRRVEVNLE